MAKVLITRDERSTPEPKVVIWSKGTRKADVVLMHDGMWCCTLDCERNTLHTVDVGVFKDIFGFVPKRGTANYYILRKPRKAKSAAERLVAALKDILNGGS